MDRIGRLLYTVLALLVTVAGPGGAQDWTSLGSTGFRVADVVLDGAGNLYAGGFENVAGGYELAHVSVRRNGVWVSIDPPGFGSVQRLAFDTFTGTLFAGGADAGFRTGIVSKFSNGVWTQLPDPGFDIGRLAVDDLGAL